MLEIAIMIEGQNGLTWPRWQKIVRMVEELGFVGLFRSDHFTNANPPDKESLGLDNTFAKNGEKEGYDATSGSGLVACALIVSQRVWLVRSAMFTPHCPTIGRKPWDRNTKVRASLSCLHATPLTCRIGVCSTTFMSVDGPVLAAAQQGVSSA